MNETQNDAASLVGFYRMGEGDSETLELRADGVAIMAGEEVPWAASGGSLALGSDVVPFRLEGGTLWLNMGIMEVPWARVEGLGATAPKAGRATLDTASAIPTGIPARAPGIKMSVGAAGLAEGMAAVHAPAAGGDGLLGAWEAPTGSAVFRADGTAIVDGQEVNYSVDGKTLRLVQGQNWRTIPYTLDGDKLVLGSGPIVTCTRAGIPGVWVGEESSLDPQFYMSIALYLTLLPNGTVGFAKSESGASRQQISESIERFRSFRQGGQAPQIVGSWQSDGASIAIQFNGRSSPVHGQVDMQAMKMSLQGMGQLPGNEGGSMLFKRQ